MKWFPLVFALGNVAANGMNEFEVRWRSARKCSTLTEMHVQTNAARMARGLPPAPPATMQKMRRAGTRQSAPELCAT